MKNVQFFFQYQPKPNHKLVSPEPHFVEEERNLLENHFYYLGYNYESNDIEEWGCFQMDNEGHLVSLNSHFTAFQLSNESIEHLSNFPQLKFFHTLFKPQDGNVTNLYLLSNLRKLSMIFRKEFQDPALLQDLVLFSNIIYLKLENEHNNSLFFLIYVDQFLLNSIGPILIPFSLSKLSNLISLSLRSITFQGLVFDKEFSLFL